MRFIIFIIFFLKVSFAYADQLQVTYAGFSFSGNFIDKDKTGQFTNKLLSIKKDNGVDIVSDSLLSTIKKVNPKNFNISFEFADLKKGSKESIVMAIALDNESYSVEYEPISKTFLNNLVNFYQILFYDFNSKKLIASIPFDTELQFFSKKKLNEQEIVNRLKTFYTSGSISQNGEKKINIFSKLENILNNFYLKNKYKFRIGVTKVIFEDKAKPFLPKQYEGNTEILNNIFAQSLSSRLSLHQSVALVPYSEGMAIGGTMKQRFVNSDEIYDVKLPKPDFNINLYIRGFKKVAAKTSDVSTVYLFGSFVRIQVLQPDINKIYFDEKIKNANQIKIPNSIKNIDEWRKFYISTLVLFDEFSANIKKPDPKWINNSLTNKDSAKKAFQNLNIVLDKVR